MIKNLGIFWKRIFGWALPAAEHWQDRPEFEELFDWCEAYDRGVCELVGIGGSGKTAIARQLASAVPGEAIAPTTHSPGKLLPTTRLFAFRLNDSGPPERTYEREEGFAQATPSQSTRAGFLSEFTTWLWAELEEDSPRGPISYPELIQKVQNATPLLVVLDGLEAVQRADGQVTDGILRQFLADAAEGLIPGLRVLATTRYSITYDNGLANFRKTIALRGLLPTTALNLLIETGLSETHTADLKNIARDYNYHPLALFLVGSFIQEFCDGDPKKLPKHLSEIQERVRSSDNQRLRQQETILSVIAENYAKKLDDRALSIMQRICFFRASVDSETLTTCIGESLPITPAETERALNSLTRLGLVQSRKSTDEMCNLYTTHRVVREQFAKLLESDEDKLRELHDEIADGLLQVFTERSGAITVRVDQRAHLDSALRLDAVRTIRQWDILTEVVRHRVLANRLCEAFHVYWHLLGGFRWLGWRFGDYERGLRLCEMLLECCTSVRHRDVLTDETDGLKEHLTEPLIRNDYGLFLYELGRMDDAITQFRLVLEADIHDAGDLSTVAVQNQIMALVVSGRLRDATELTKQLPAKGPSRKWAPFTSLCRALPSLLRGRTIRNAANKDLELARTKARILTKPHRINHGAPAVIHSRIHIVYASVACRRGDLTEAEKVVGAVRESLKSVFADEHHDLPKCWLIEAEIALKRQDVDRANRLAQLAHDWALQRDARVILCWSQLLLASVAVRVVKNLALSDPGYDEAVVTARARIASGLQLARRHGYQLYWIDLMLLSVKLALCLGEERLAENHIRAVLEGGTRQSGVPDMHNVVELDYAWGLAEARHMLGEVMLLKAAIANRSGSYAPRSRSVSPIVRDTIRRAKLEFAKASRIWHRLCDPNADASAHPKQARTNRVLLQLKSGELTPYPVVAGASGAGPVPLDPATASPKGSKENGATSKRFNVALSFPGEHRAYVGEIAGALAGRLTKDRVFYDRYYEAELSRPNLDTYLQEIYHDQTELVVVVLCKEYDQKEWCGLEFRAIRDLIKQRRDDEVMFVRVADGDVKGVFGIDGYVDAQNRPATDIADIICQRLKLVQAAGS